MTKKEKCAQGQRGRIVIHKDLEELRIWKSDLDTYLSKGWSRGFSEAHRQQAKTAHLGQTAWNKGLTKETSASIMSTSQKLTGIKRDTAPWNKGIHYKLESQILQNKLDKEYQTKKKNNTFNTSKPEEILYKQLITENPGKKIYRQYKDPERYPFYCDFYIVEDDLFIELNNHWSHGEKPYDPNDPECIKLLSVWKEKAKESQFYANAIKTWTERDVAKFETARKNNLNYKVIYKL